MFLHTKIVNFVRKNKLRRENARKTQFLAKEVQENGGHGIVVECRAEFTHRVHGEDGYADIHRADGDERRGDGAERRASAAVAAVQEVLMHDAALFAERPHDGDGLGIARIGLRRRLLDDDTTA